MRTAGITVLVFMFCGLTKEATYLSNLVTIQPADLKYEYKIELIKYYSSFDHLLVALGYSNL